MGHASEGSSLEMSSERVRPRVSCASRMVRSRPGRPLMFRYCTARHDRHSSGSPHVSMKLWLCPGPLIAAQQLTRRAAAQEPC